MVVPGCDQQGFAVAKLAGHVRGSGGLNCDESPEHGPASEGGAPLRDTSNCAEQSRGVARSRGSGPEAGRWRLHTSNVSATLLWRSVTLTKNETV